MRDLYKALSEFENSFETAYGVTLNEAMILCSLKEADSEMTSSALSERTELKPAHTSKIIGGIEDKGLIVRSLGKEDKRQMFFSLTENGQKLLKKILADNIEIPQLIKPLFK